MRWICEIEQSSDELLATVIEGEKVERILLRDLCSLNLKTQPDQARFDLVNRAYVEWAFDEIRPAAENFLRKIRELPTRVSASQSFFVAKHHGRELLIPAQELIRVLFGRSNRCWSLLFTPRGPVVGKIPTMQKSRSGASSTVDPKASANRIHTKARRRLEVMQDHLLWPQSYPSARAGWGSVYAKALGGELGLSIPRARYAFTLNYCESERYPIAFGVLLRSITPMEEPFAGNDGVDPSTLGGKHSNTSPGCLPSRAGNWQCSETEWEEISRKIRTLLPWTTRTSKRNITDLILQKFGQGIMWEKLPAEPRTIVAARKWAYQVKKTGLLQEIFEFIRNSRNADRKRTRRKENE